jgi:heat shock protein HtpX
MLIYFVLSLFALNLSRLREYYADLHGASVVKDGARKLSEGLAKIVTKTGTMRMRGHREAFMLNGFKSLFISDPDRAEQDFSQISQYASMMPDERLVEQLLNRKITAADKIIEFLSTHPNISKRLALLQELENQG